MKSEPKNKTGETAPAPAPAPAAPAPAEASLMEGELGEIKIHEDVIANLVAMATLKVPGVSRLAGSTVVDAIASIVGSRRMQARAITIGLAGDNRVTVDLKLNILVGYRLPEVVQQVQRSVIDNIEDVTGMTVTRVNVAVQDIDEQPVEEDDEDEDKEDGTGSVPPAAIPPMP
ncbi:MAG: Asp23/Gls24 family envelope stress response protein [Lentisphaeria bacterium]|nr:Asp23/Gls24 family envelope stress response protein [Lentisphaeria bacterium]